MPWQGRSSSRRSQLPVITLDHLAIALSDHLRYNPESFTEQGLSFNCNEGDP
ncbi:MAG: hypothetical protein V7L04_17170 [Nostoc sp.]|uniref:hypothetical protein n=1 Tax=Nostoc sp. TaxID=1180 RepID=UPI002FF906B5